MPGLALFTVWIYCRKDLKKVSNRPLIYKLRMRSQPRISNFASESVAQLRHAHIGNQNCASETAQTAEADDNVQKQTASMPER